MKIYLTSVLVDDQDKALSFYTEWLGFVKKTEIPLGQHRWLTVVAPEDPGGPELLLEPDEHPAAKTFKQAMLADGIPCMSFAVADVHAEFDRLSAAGARALPERSAPSSAAVQCAGSTCRETGPPLPREFAMNSS